jgi:cytochrome c5
MTGLSAILVLASIALSAAAAMDDKSIRDRTMPVGKVCVEGEDCGSASAAAASGPMAPEDIYSNSCAGCHASGVLGAPKLGDAAAWSGRLDKGLDQLIANAINGINAMPPKGTCASCSDDDIGATVQYMVDGSK